MPTNSAITFLGAQSGNTLATAVALSKLGDSFVAPPGVPKAGQTIFESDFGYRQTVPDPVDNGFQVYDSLKVASLGTENGITVSQQNFAVGIDCSNFVALTELASGYNVTYVTAANVATGLMNGAYTVGSTVAGSYTIIDPSQVQPNDIVIFQGSDAHMGVVQNPIGSDNGLPPTFIGSQSSTGVAVANFGPGQYWGGNGEKIVGYMRVNDNTYVGADNLPAAQQSMLSGLVADLQSVQSQRGGGQSSPQPVSLPQTDPAFALSPADIQKVVSTGSLWSLDPLYSAPAPLTYWASSLPQSSNADLTQQIENEFYGSASSSTGSQSKLNQAFQLFDNQNNSVINTNDDTGGLLSAQQYLDSQPSTNNLVGSNSGGINSSTINTNSVDQLRRTHEILVADSLVHQRQLAPQLLRIRRDPVIRRDAAQTTQARVGERRGGRPGIVGRRRAVNTRCIRLQLFNSRRLFRSHLVRRHGRRHARRNPTAERTTDRSAQDDTSSSKHVIGAPATNHGRARNARDLDKIPI